MNTINERISQVVKESGLTKTAFAERINVSPGMVSKLCSASAQPSDRTISDICREFGVNEDWLRSGIGDMREAVTPEEEVSELVARAVHGSSDFRRAVIRMICTRTDTELEVLDKMLQDLYETLQKNSGQE